MSLNSELDPPSQKQPLRRSAKYALAGGVCSGYAITQNLSIALVRVFTVLLFFFSAGAMLAVYLAAWILMPGPATGPQGWDHPVPREHLFRRANNQVIGGVCGAFADYFKIDPTVMRLIVVCLALIGGAGAFTYLCAWAIIPKQPSSEVVV